jgi:hypothetical protein
MGFNNINLKKINFVVIFIIQGIRSSDPLPERTSGIGPELKE